MAKRTAEVPSDMYPPNKKVHFEPVNLGPVSSLEEMNMRTLYFQNKKLAQRLEQRCHAEATLRERIEQLEKRQTQDDAVLNVVNRYWNQLNEDIRVMLQRFDAETADEAENINENEATTSFLTLLSTWDKQELDEKLANRVQVSKRAVAKILQAFDRLQQRNEKLMLMLQNEGNGKIDSAALKANADLLSENKQLHNMMTKLQEHHHVVSIQMSELQDKGNALETEIAELKNRLHDSEYELNKNKCRAEKLETHLAEALEKLKSCQLSTECEGKNKNQLSSISQNKFEDLQQELEVQRELSVNRLQELEKLHHDHKETLKEVEKLKMDIRQLPESVIVETTEYKCLQSQYSVLYNESMQLKTLLEETRNILQNSKNAHLRQIEQMESEELLSQRKLRTEVIQLEDMLAQLRKEYEMLRIEFEQNLTANEQTGPINREMRHLITSLQKHIHQLRENLNRYKKKYKESINEMTKLKKDLGEIHHQKQNIQSQLHSILSNENHIKDKNHMEVADDVREGILIKQEATIIKNEDLMKETCNSTVCTQDLKKEIKKELKMEAKFDCKKDLINEPENKEIKIHLKNYELEAKELKMQLKKAQCEQKEMKLLLDMYKGVAKDKRDKVQLMASEKRAKEEIENLKLQLKRMAQDYKRDDKKISDEETSRKIRQLEDKVHQLQKQVQAQKQEEEALLNEMEVTGQAFEDMQEQNIRLIQQLREKDDANFKLMSERIKSNQIHKLVTDEKEMLIEQVNTLRTQVEAQNQVVRKLEEKERILQSNITLIEKELNLRQQALEMHKRKAIESAQSAADLKLHLEKYHSQVKEAQQTVAEKTSALEAEAYKTLRLQEDNASLKRKVERSKKFEMATTADEVLTAENKEYKEQLTCPSCKVKRKDAVLTKCFHVFCFDCLRTRYETRQRKCPKCNAAFGANDYHRLYLS